MKRRNRFILLAVIVIAMLLIDRLTKVWAVDGGVLQHGVSNPDSGPISLTLVFNRGAAFGIGQGSTALFIAIAIAIVIAVVLWLALGRDVNVPEALGLSLVAAGGIGNLIDRLTTVYVVDFIQFDFIDFPVFNVADICVTCGVALFIVAMFAATFKSGVQEHAADGDASNGQGGVQ